MLSFKLLTMIVNVDVSSLGTQYTGNKTPSKIALLPGTPSASLSTHS